MENDISNHIKSFKLLCQSVLKRELFQFCYSHVFKDFLLTFQDTTSESGTQMAVCV